MRKRKEIGGEAGINQRDVRSDRQKSIQYGMCARSICMQVLYVLCMYVMYGMYDNGMYERNVRA